MPLDLTGAVAITGASGQVGKALVRRLEELPNEVRPLGGDDDLAGTFRDADLIVHLAGTLRPAAPNTYREANLETVRRTVAALEGSSVKGVVFLSYVGADPASRNEYVRTKGQAEDLLYRSGKNIIIFRCTHIYGPPEEPGPMVSAMLAQGGRAVTVLGDGFQRVAPVCREDVVEAILRAGLDSQAPTGRFDLPGPDVMTLKEFVRVVNGGDVRLRHVPSMLARALSHVMPGLTPALVDVLLSDSVAEPGRVERAFGLGERRRVGDLYARRLPVAA
jgi:uncharacterized protein YbjT (DUF2867 family)